MHYSGAAFVRQSGTRTWAPDDELLNPLRFHDIRAKFLAEFLRTTQKLADALAQGATQVPTPRARVPNEVLAASRLFISPHFKAASFGLRLRLSRPDESDANLYPPQVRGEMLDVLSSLLTADAALFSTTRYDTPRVRTHLYALLDLIADQRATVVVRTKGNPSGTRVTPRQARDRLDIATNIDESRVTIGGVLTGGSISNKRFEITLSYGATIAGRATASAARKLRGLSFGSRVSADVRERTIERHDGNSRFDYLLLDIGLAPSRSPANGEEAEA